MWHVHTQCRGLSGGWGSFDERLFVRFAEEDVCGPAIAMVGVIGVRGENGEGGMAKFELRKGRVG